MSNPKGNMLVVVAAKVVPPMVVAAGGRKRGGVRGRLMVRIRIQRRMQTRSLKLNSIVCLHNLTA